MLRNLIENNESSITMQKTGKGHSECKIRDKKELYEEIIRYITGERSYLLSKNDLYKFLRKDKNGVTRKTYKQELVEQLKDVINVDNLEAADKELGIKLYQCDLMKIFGLSYKRLKRIIDIEQIPHGYRGINYDWKGQAHTYNLDSICKIYDILAAKQNLDFKAV